MSEVQTVPLEELAELPEIYHPIVSPDGSKVAFYYDESGRNELYVLDRATGDYEQISDGDVPRDAMWYPRWAATGDRIYFHRDDAGDEQNDIYGISLDGDVDPVVEPDGQGILFDSTEQFLLYGSDEGEQLNLYRHTLDTGETQQLTEYAHPIRGGRFSPAGDRIAYVANESDTLENLDVYVMAADGSEKRRLDIGEDGSETSLGGWFPDGRRLLVSDNSTDRRQVGVYDLETESVRWLGSNDHEEDAVAVSPGGSQVLVTRARRGATMPVVYDVDSGSGRELAFPEGESGLFQFQGYSPGGVFVDDSTLVIAHSQADERRQCYEYDLETDETEVLVAANYGDLDPDIFVDAEYVEYESDDGLTIGGLLYDPRDGPTRRPDETDVPAVVWVHGGPHFRETRRFNLHVQFLASRGYAVFLPNYRGSTGRGREFKHAIHGDWGGMEQTDIAEGGRWLQDRDWIDGERVAVFGGSYGGYSAYSQLTQYPTLWTTGIAWVGMTDLHRLFEDDMPHFQHQLRMQMGDPEENYDLWRDRSPIEHVDQVERPIFMIHGVNDPRCPIDQARIFRDALEERGWTQGDDFEYEELGEEGHASTDIQQKIRVFRLLEDYLDRRL
ncbi:prolyl oligopeptidase family serine peptidase [Halobacteriales archaeon Cl-PHB]